MWKKVSIKPNSAAILTKKQLYKMAALEEGDRFPYFYGDFHLAKEPFLVLTARDEKPLLVFYVMVTNKDISAYEKKPLIKKIIKDKLKMQTSSLSERIFRMVPISAGLHELGIRDEEELLEKFPRIREYVILLNDSNDIIDIDMHRETISKIFSLN
jgi:hypothetical protein